MTTQAAYPIGGRQCEVFSTEGTPRALLLQLVSERQEADLVREVALIDAAGIPFVLVAVPVADWELELMPWAEPAVSKRPEVGTGAGETLRYLMEALLPAVLPPPPAGTPPTEENFSPL